MSRLDRGRVALIALTTVTPCDRYGDWLLLRALVLGMPLGALGVLVHRGGIAGSLAALVVPAGAVLNPIGLPLPAESRMATPVAVTIWSGAIAGVVLIAIRLVRERTRAAAPAGAGGESGPSVTHSRH